MKSIFRPLALAQLSLLSIIAVTSAVRAAVSGSPAPENILATGPFASIRSSMAWEIALVPHVGTEKSDVQIAKQQAAVRAATDPRPPLERLGWLFVAKARESNDSGFYKLAEQCASALESHGEKNLGALLLRGHVAQSLHRFKEAEAIARQLVAERELAFDHGLLGDALADQGKLDEAIRAYQRMADLRPELQSYSRVAHARWLKGDLAGAIEGAKLAARAASPQNPEPAAWALTRLATFQLQSGAEASADSSCMAARQFVPDYAPALLLQGRMRLSAGDPAEAVDLLQRAVGRNSLPEYQWALAEALRAAEKATDAEKVESDLQRQGRASDPRTLAVFLATRGQQTDLALRLAKRELEERADVFTYDALAWAQSAVGDNVAAWTSMQRALSEGTEDARMLLHAAVIAARLGRDDAASRLEQARRLAGLLLPSEKSHLDRAAQLLPERITSDLSRAELR